MTSHQREQEVFRIHGGLLRTSRALNLGIHPRTLYQMREAGVIEALSRGLYRLTHLPPHTQPDLALVGLKIPNGVICLISALAFHKLTTQIPHEVHVALKQGSEKPRLTYPPTRFFWLSKSAFSEGVERHPVDAVTLKVYGMEKTVADCFKFRHRLGLDVALEALKRYRERNRPQTQLLLKYARINRVERVMKPYLEALL